MKLRRPIKKGMMLTIGFLLAFGALFSLWRLNEQISERFEGRRFFLPSQVFAEPFTLTTGAPGQNRPQILRELGRLGYLNQTSAIRPGRFKLNPESIDLHLRPFAFLDRKRPALRVRLTFEEDRLNGIYDGQNNPLASIDLEPLLIGGIYPAVEEDRLLVHLAEVPKLLIDGLIAVEDRRFFHHFGLSPSGIARALLTNIRTGQIKQGGSTISQQLVKNLFLSRERTLTRKLQEAAMAVIMEFRYSKADILETYINQVYFGQNGSRSFHGFGLAAQRFFGMNLNQLSADQIALLVGMLKGPNFYNPRQHPERALSRRNTILRIFRQENILSAAAYQKAVNAPLHLEKELLSPSSAFADYMDLVKKQLTDFYPVEDLQKDGLRIFTHLKPHVQEALGSLKPKKFLEQVAIHVDYHTGHVEGLTGGTPSTSVESNFNRALLAKRSIGSLIKPFIYLTAFEEGYHLGSMLQDRPIRIEDHGQIWQPENYDHQSHGETMLLQALAKSYNLATVNLGMHLGLGRVAKTLQQLAAKAPDALYPSLLLGAVEYTPLEMAQAYLPLAAQGFQIPLSSIRSVTDAKGEVLKRFELSISEVVEAPIQYQTLWALRETATHGTARSLAIAMPDRRFAGKTGTSQDGRDLWFAGISARHLTVLWQGRDDNQPTPYTAATSVVPQYASLAKTLQLESLQINPPEGIQMLNLHQDGTIYGADCPLGERHPFPDDLDPEQVAPCYPQDVVLDFFSRMKKFLFEEDRHDQKTF